MRVPQLLGRPGGAGVAQRLPERQVRQRQARLGKRLAVVLGEAQRLGHRLLPAAVSPASRAGR